GLLDQVVGPVAIGIDVVEVAAIRHIGGTFARDLREDRVQHHERAMLIRRVHHFVGDLLLLGREDDTAGDRGENQRRGENEEKGAAGDGGPAVSAQVSDPTGLCRGPDGLYFCDTDNHKIRRIATNGVITTVAGNGTKGYSGDGGPATAAQLAEPYEVRFDRVG